MGAFMAATDADNKTLRIRQLNDQARRTLTGATVVLTRAVYGMDVERKYAILARVASFEDFSPENDPHGEHDMGFFECDGQAFFFAFSYYDSSLQDSSEDPSDPGKTARVLTIGFAEDY